MLPPRGLQGGLLSWFPTPSSHATGWTPPCLPQPGPATRTPLLVLRHIGLSPGLCSLHPLVPLPGASFAQAAPHFLQVIPSPWQTVLPSPLSPSDLLHPQSGCLLLLALTWWLAGFFSSVFPFREWPPGGPFFCSLLALVSVPIRGLHVLRASYLSMHACWMSLLPQWQRIHLPSRRQGFDPWVEKIPWRRKGQLTPAFLPGKSHGQRTQAGYSPRGWKRIRHCLATKKPQQQHPHFVGKMMTTQLSIHYF